jgi:hypothetical protein
MSIPQRTWHRVGHANAGDAVAVRYYPEDQSERNAFKAQFRSRKFCKRTVDSPSYRIFGRMHEALNIDKK